MDELAIQISILEQVKCRLYQEVAEINAKIKKIEFEMEVIRMGKFDGQLDKIMAMYDKKEQKLATIQEEIPKPPAGTPADPLNENPIEEAPVVVAKKEEPPTSGWLGGWWSSSGNTPEKIEDNYVKVAAKPASADSQSPQK